MTLDVTADAAPCGLRSLKMKSEAAQRASFPRIVFLLAAMKKD